MEKLNSVPNHMEKKYDDQSWKDLKMHILISKPKKRCEYCGVPLTLFNKKTDQICEDCDFRMQNLFVCNSY